MAGLLGINGAGKTTLVKLMMGLIQPTTGTITVNGVSLSSLSQTSRFKLFAPVFQDIDMWALTLSENISLQSHGNLDHILELLDDVGLIEKYHSLPLGLETPLTRNIEEDGIELSGGERQKLMLARSIVNDPAVILADEPTGALDTETSQQIIDLFIDLNKMGKTIIIVTHNLDIANQCNRIVYIKDGRI